MNDVPARLIRIFLGELEERLSTFDADLVALEAAAPDDDRSEIVSRLFRDAHSLKGAAASVGASGIEMMCQQLEDTLAAVRNGTRAIDGALCDGLFAAADALRVAGRDLDSGSPPPEQPAPRVSARAPLRDPNLRVDAGKVDALLEQSGELLVAHHRTNELHREVVDAAATVQHLRDAPPGMGRKRHREELRELHRTLERIATSLNAESGALERASGDLDDGIRALRLVPFGQACESLDRVVRDAAKATGKRVRLEIEGTGVGVDRATIERLRDSLVQLVRNAIDHGIETPEERIRLGKPPDGVVRLSAQLRARNFEVIVSDDGRGLDLDHLRSRMRERGIPFEEHDLARAVFLPGLSTAESVTKLSGRGVGLDVVRTEVEALNGTVEVTSARNAGASFVLAFPPVSTTLRVILVRSGAQTFGINVSAVERAVRIGEADLAYVEGRSMLLAGGNAVPLVPLHAILGLEPDTETPQPIALVLMRGRQTVAVSVDALVDEREIHLRPLGPRLRALPLVAGASVAGDGSIALILRSSVVVASALSARTARPAVPAAVAKTAATRVLLVDDSITTRTLERSILEAAGFEVLTAADGAAAWQLLGEHSVDLVVSDVDMPRMDGFSLVEAMRASAALREVPIILVTARENESDRQRGLEIGADAYIVKSSFRQEELLDAIGALT